MLWKITVITISTILPITWDLLKCIPHIYINRSHHEQYHRIDNIHNRPMFLRHNTMGPTRMDQGPTNHTAYMHHWNKLDKYLTRKRNYRNSKKLFHFTCVFPELKCFLQYHIKAVNISKFKFYEKPTIHEYPRKIPTNLTKRTQDTTLNLSFSIFQWNFGASAIFINQ